MAPASWPWGEGVWEVPAWALALFVLLVSALSLWILGSRARRWYQGNR
jgi:hypothetical protein